MPSRPGFPWLEVNQGALSLAALAFAILWGLGEQYRANHAEELRQRRAFVDAADIIERYGNMLQLWNHPNFGIPFAVLCERLNHAADIIRDFATAHASTPMMAITVLRASTQLRIAARAPSPNDLVQIAPRVLLEIETVKVELQNLLSYWDAQHRGKAARAWLWLRYKTIGLLRPFKKRVANAE